LDWAEDINVTSNIIANNNGSGIYSDRCSDLNITGNKILNNDFGINFYDTFNNNIENNNISLNNRHGLRLLNSGGNKITGNILSNNKDGILVENTGDNDIESNIISSNTRNGIWIYWYVDGNNIKFNNISNNLNGINISTYSEDNVMTTNDISNNLYGVVIDSSDSNTFTRNSFVSNTLYAIDITSGEFNFIYHNNFIDNNAGGVQASDKTGMSGWYVTYPNGGNYWNDWTTPDIKSGPNQDQPGSDGFVDFPYDLDGGVSAKDRYPFAVPVDFLPPVITNLQPPDGSIINDSSPTISANYSDPSGIDESSVVLIVNGIDVTSSSTVTATRVGYLPGTPLSDGVHTVYIEVRDIFGYLATETWSFTVDATPPIITNLQPPDTSTTNVNTPTISADYSDPSGINATSVVLTVDGIDITLFAFVTVSGVSYIPGMVLSDGVHTVYIEVRDNVGNLAFVTWTFTVDTALPPPTNLTTKVVNNDNNIELEWEPPISFILDHYLIYRAASATEFDFSTPYNSSTTWLDPKNTIWVDPDPSVTAMDDDFYYIVRAANFDESDISSTSNTAGVWTRTFEPGISTFSLPLEPFEKKDTEFYSQDMNASYIRWMNLTTHTWMQHDKGDTDNNTFLELGEGYEIGYLGKSIQSKYTFTGLPGAMIIYDDDSGFAGFNPVTEADSLAVSVEPNGNVTLNWQEPSSMTSGDWYEVYYSNTRDGFFGTFGVHYDLACPSNGFGTNITTISGLGATDPGARLYFMVVPFNASGVRGSSTYSIGVWTEEYLAGYDTIGIPLKLSTYTTTDWYCDNIPDVVGINYYILNRQRWGWHSTRMPEGAYDPVLEMAKGYQISTSNATKFTFVGV
jgi:parallel beta-helix repeat protein